MAVPLEIGILDLRLEFLAHALIFLGALKTTRAVSALTLKALLHRPNDLLVGVQSNLHMPFLSD
jgi:hypothetical protein